MKTVLKIAAILAAIIIVPPVIYLKTHGPDRPDLAACKAAMINKGFIPRSYDEAEALEQRIAKECH